MIKIILNDEILISTNFNFNQSEVVKCVIVYQLRTFIFKI